MKVTPALLWLALAKQITALLLLPDLHMRQGL